MDPEEQGSGILSEVLVDENKVDAKLELVNGEVDHAVDLKIATSIAEEHTAESLPKVTGSPARASPDVEAGSKTTPTKGYGLKKWRRIRRDLGTDTPGGHDSAQILKRRHSLPEPVKIRDESNAQKGDAEGEGSVSITHNSVVSSTKAIAIETLNPEFVLLMASGGFSVGADSNNSEEGSSISSTAASAPRLRHEAGVSLRERSKGKGSGGKGALHPVQQRSQRGRGGGIDGSKKFRGNQVWSNKENSQSSVESEFVRWDSAVNSNGKQSELSVNGGGEHGDEFQTCEEVGTGYYKENGTVRGSLREDFERDFAVFACDDLAEADPQEVENNGKSDSSQLHTDLDPFVESMVLLQVAQEALEAEIQKFGEIAEEPTLDGLLDGTEESISPALGSHFLELNQKIKHLEHRLEEASATIKAKESKVLELEAILNISPHMKDMEFELEALIKKRIEAEVEFLITSRATRDQEAQAKEQIFLMEEHRSLLKDQEEIMLKLRESESKAAVLKGQAEELEARCQELLGTGEVFEMQSKACKSSLCCVVQLVMMCIALWWFLMQLLLISDGIVPT